MSDEASAPAGGGSEAIAVITPAESTPETLSVSQAARALAAARHKPKQEAAPAQDAVETPQELPETASDAQPPADPVETQEAEPAEVPPIEPPRSWSKEERERFQNYPRELQAYLSEREQQRDRDLRQRQNEAAEKLKGLTAKEQAVEEARQQYEKALPALLQTLQEAQQGQFGDIKTPADVQKLAAEDPFRYLQYDAHQKQVAALKAELDGAQERQAKEWQSKWAEFADREDKLTAERIPELADPAQRTKVQEGAVSYLKDIGFSETELGSAWNGQASLSLRDHRVQEMIRDAVKYREGKENAQKLLKPERPLPPVQKPGIAPSKGAGNEATIKTLSSKLDQTGSLKDAAALIRARRAAR